MAVATATLQHIFFERLLYLLGRFARSGDALRIRLNPKTSCRFRRISGLAQYMTLNKIRTFLNSLTGQSKYISLENMENNFNKLISLRKLTEYV